MIRSKRLSNTRLITNKFLIYAALLVDRFEWRGRGTTGETVEGGNHANRDLIASFRSFVHGMSGLVRSLEHRRAFGLLLRPNVSRRVMADPRQKPICHLLDRPRTSDPRNYHATRGWVEFFSLNRAPTDSVLRYFAYRRGKHAAWNSMLPLVIDGR